MHQPDFTVYRARRFFCFFYTVVGSSFHLWSWGGLAPTLQEQTDPPGPTRVASRVLIRMKGIQLFSVVVCQVSMFCGSGGWVGCVCVWGGGVTR